MAITWYIWRGDIFRVPLSTLQLPKQKGGWGLLNIAAKCKALYAYRLRATSTGGSMLTALWLRKWGLTKKEENPPHLHRIPIQLEYLRIYALDSAYISEREAAESERAYKCRLYTTMCILLKVETDQPVLRITRRWSNTDWATVWTNVHEAPVPTTVKVTWYKVINDIIPTRARLFTIRLAQTDQCEHCPKSDTMLHRLTECELTTIIWERTRQLIATILRTDWRRIPEDWLMRPTIKLWPPKRHRAVLWMLATYVRYCTQRHRELMLSDYYDFLRRSRWKMDTRTNRDKLVGNYLSVIPANG